MCIDMGRPCEGNQRPPTHETIAKADTHMAQAQENSNTIVSSPKNMNMFMNMNDLSVFAKVSNYNFLLLDVHLQRTPTETSLPPTSHLHVVPNQLTGVLGWDAIGSGRY